MTMQLADLVRPTAVDAFLDSPEGVALTGIAADAVRGLVDVGIIDPDRAMDARGVVVGAVLRREISLGSSLGLAAQAAIRADREAEAEALGALV